MSFLVISMDSKALGLLFFVFLLGFNFASGNNACSSVSIGKSAEGDFDEDVVSKGSITELWEMDSSYKTVIQKDEKLDYFYIKNQTEIDVILPNSTKSSRIFPFSFSSV